MSRSKVLLLLLFCVLAQGAMAQSKVISGTVEDPMGPVMFANVTERDADSRIVSFAQTDMMGNFSMEIKSPKNKLVISYVGNKTVEIVIGNQSSFTIVMQPESTEISEVIVEGKRVNSGGLSIPDREMTVAQQTFKLSEVEGMAFTSADEALQGEIAGLDIVVNSGNLGAGTTMRLRGVTSINGNAEPLIVVDDIIFDNPDETFDFQNASEEQYASLLSVNVEDIDDIKVLKDAAATAVWGSKGANGVIVITTKRGSRGKPRVSLSYKYTGTWQPEGYDLLNGDDYTMLMKEEFYNPNQSNTATANIREINYDRSWAEYQNWNNNTDWVDAVTQFGGLHSYNLNISGGGEKAQFRISGGYEKQSGSIIQQEFDRFTTRLVLDYDVSSRIRFQTNFALTYTDNLQNYAGLLGKAQQIAPNMSIYRQDAAGNDLDEFHIMNPQGTLNGNTPYNGNYSSYELRSIRSLGNPIAYSELAWKNEQTYRITPNFELRYELLGVDYGEHRLTFKGRVDFDIYAASTPAYAAAGLSTSQWGADFSYNTSEKSESNRLRVGTRGEFVFTPYFQNEDWSATMLARYEVNTQRSTNQFVRQFSLPDGITSPTAPGALPFDNKTNGLSSGNSRANSQYWLYNAHASYKGIYNLGFSLRADGDSKFGPKQKWAYFPGVSLRYNLSDEAFFEPIREEISMLGLRASWGIVGKAPDADYLFFNAYNLGAGSYGGNSTAVMDGLKLDDLRWEKTTSYNLGFNLTFLKDIINVDFDYYHKDTRDLLQTKVAIPTTTGYSQLAYQNVGSMTNDGWEMNVNANKFLKIGKFSMSAGFNIAQNYNEITEMDDRVLSSINSEWDATSRGTFQNRIQVGNPLGSIYGFRYKGVYQYTYDYLTNMRTEKGWSNDEFEANLNQMLAEGKTFPVVVGADGKVIMQSNGLPQRMVYNYVDGNATYSFQGGDAIYEDINHDGQINALDIVYLGNCLPKLSGGFNVSFNYGKWNFKARFMYRYGNKVINEARRSLESMSNAYNQTSSVNWRWRKDGDVTLMPRAIFQYDDGSAYNSQGSSRYVEDGSFVRFQNLQFGYNFPTEKVKRYGLNRLQVYVTANNLFCWTRYSGVDPEIAISGWGLATDKSQTPRPKSFTANVSIEF